MSSHEQPTTAITASLAAEDLIIGADTADRSESERAAFADDESAPSDEGPPELAAEADPADVLEQIADIGYDDEHDVRS